MDYVNLRYERIANLIAVAASNREKEYNKLYIKPLEDTVYIVSFSDYVKSQIHLNIISRLFVRKFLAYKSVYDSFNGGKIVKDDYELVLNYFYEDMANFLIFNPNNFKLQLCVDISFDWLPRICISFDEVQLKLNNLCEIKNDFNSLLSSIESDSHFKIIDGILDSEDLLAKIDSYTVASILQDVGSKIIDINGGFYADTVK